MQALSHGFSNLATFTGRTPRRHFWPFAAVVFVVGYVLYVVALFPAVASSVVPVAGYMEERAVQVEARAAGYAVRVPVEDPARLSPMITALAWACAGFVTLMFCLLAAAAVRRLHDTGRSGWWGMMPLPFLLCALIMLPQVMGRVGTQDIENSGLLWLLMANNVCYILAILTLIVFLAQRSQPGANRFGNNPG